MKIETFKESQLFGMTCLEEGYIKLVWQNILFTVSLRIFVV